jgi:PPOX class probable F420-dependent enzyme
VDLAAARAFLEDHHRAVLATTRADGRPQLSPVVCGLHDDGRVAVSTRETAIKARNARRDPRVSLCVLSDRFFGEWVQLDGTAELVALPAAMDGLVALYRRVAGEHEDWGEFRRAMHEERRVLMLVEIERAGPDRAG